ncbi:hypothetical protein CCU68_24410 [Pseudomonas gingeri NCPPB 3146 = LMG 5327]|uniref:Uncharacterized protein n=2 Tax=Pseudomonas gingeri TaxID=117681 RepID=A0A7Y7Y1V2_9PSED|nr:hypothetical protein [Pseudomonas gingeri]NWC16041.1 hypothetical protein [Pseudomonas gingeri]PNQ89840.1 hypothetical protein CCU68_24410 [Pseudomonas gingeri NCPPB 3146 = LMG 5327]
MNGISRVSPTVEPVPDFPDEAPDGIGQGLEGLEEEVILAGAATLFAVLQQVQLPASGPGRAAVSPGGSRRAEVGTGSVDRPQEPFGDRAGPGLAPAEGPLNQGDVEGARISTVAAAEERVGWARGTAGVDGQPGDGLDARTQAMPAHGEGPLTGSGANAASMPPETGAPVPETEPGSPSELLPGSLLVRSEPQALAGQVLAEGASGEQDATPERHDGAPPEPAEQEDDGTGQHFLQVPFSNERARGEVLITREGAGSTGLLIRASDRQVFEQLQVNFDRNRQPHWWLDDGPLSPAPDDGGRGS